MSYLSKTAGGDSQSKLQYIWVGHRGQWFIVYKNRPDYQEWQEAKTSIITHNHAYLSPSSTEAINHQLPHLCNKSSNICSQVDRRSLRAPPALTKLMTQKRPCRHCGYFKLPSNLPRDKGPAPSYFTPTPTLGNQSRRDMVLPKSFMIEKGLS